MAIDNRAWFMKYKPTKIEELVFPNTLNGSPVKPEDIKKIFIDAVNNQFIPGNVLSYGPGGFGKSSLADVLVKSIIKEPKDFYRLGKGVDAIEDLKAWLVSKPGRSNQKIVLIEEADKLSPQAQNMLKDGLLEKFQAYVSFIANTNHPHKIDAALRTRFNMQLNFKEIQAEQAFFYVLSILDKEQIKYNRDYVWEFISKNIQKGLRVILNNIEINVKDKVLGSIGELESSSNNEDYILDLLKYLIQYAEAQPKESLAKLLVNVDNDPQFAQYYKAILDTTKSDLNLDYDYIFNMLLDENFSIDIKNVLIENYQDIDNKKFPNLHLVSTMGKLLLNIHQRKGGLPTETKNQG